MRISHLLLAAAITAGFTAPSAAAPAVCAPVAHGVPWMDGPPNWIADTAHSPSHPSWDDPRWRGASKLAYGRGAATPPVEFRVTWGTRLDCTPSATDTCQDAFLQWRIKTAIFQQPHVLLFALKRPGTTTGVLVQLNLAQLLPTTGGYVAPGKFATPTECIGSPECTGATSDKFMVFTQRANLDPAAPGTSIPSSCRPGQAAYASWEQVGTGVAADAPTWVAPTARYQRECTSSATPGAVDSCEYWTVSVRIPVTTTGADFAQGMQDGDLFWYELVAPISTGFPVCTTLNPCVRIDSWPRTPNPTSTPVSVDEICQDASQFDPAKWLNANLTDDAAWSPLRTASSASATDCFGGLEFSSSDVGVIVDPGTVNTATTGGLGWVFKGFLASSPTTRATNRMVARIHNDTPGAVSAALKARFRIAEWGVQPSTGDIDPSKPYWTDPTSNPSCLEDTNLGDPRSCVAGDVAIPAGGVAVVSTDWELTDDQICRWGFTPEPAVGCEVCTCPPEVVPSTGTVECRHAKGSSACGRVLHHHQCMLVELSSDSDVDIKTSSVYRNMEVVQMSEGMQTAWISTRGAPTAPGQKLEEVYLVVMPRNVPATVPAGSTGLGLIQSAAARQRDRLVKPYVEVARRLSPQELELAVAAAGRDPIRPIAVPPRLPIFGQPRIEPRVLAIMPRAARAEAEVFDGLARYDGHDGYDDGMGGTSYGAAAATEVALDTLTDQGAAEIVPTLDIYAYRHIPGDASMTPLTSFTMMGHHDGPLTGITWEIDGAQRLGPNLFKVAMPVGHRKSIQVRMKSGDGTAQARGNPNWPCAGGCACNKGYCSEPDLALGNGLPLLAVGAMWSGLGVRRRKRKAATKA